MPTKQQYSILNMRMIELWQRHINRLFLGHIRWLSAASIVHLRHRMVSFQDSQPNSTTVQWTRLNQQSPPSDMPLKKEMSSHYVVRRRTPTHNELNTRQLAVGLFSPGPLHNTRQLDLPSLGPLHNTRQLDVR